MQFFTPIPIAKSNHTIGYDSKVVSLGSCFAVNMAEKLDHFQFRQTVNPFGILFHPVAIEQLIGHAENKKVFSESDVFFHNEHWHCFDAHSDLSDADQRALIGKLNSAVQSAHDELTEATHIIITYGTAWAYRFKTSQHLVANCHKIPQPQFDKELLSVAQIEQSIQNTIQALRRLNPTVDIIFTISPVRHIKDGFVQNQRSKSNLIAALHTVLENEPADYFPSYEIMMDELRDYRFYANDMLHPSQMAVDYIWERFSQTHISESALPIMEQVDGIRKGLAHRPFHQQSASHRQFLEKINAKIAHLQRDFPHMHF